MNLFDLPLKELQSYKPNQTKQTDFGTFWDKRIQESMRQPLNVLFTKRDYCVKDVEVFDISFDGFRNSRIHAVYVKPRQLTAPTPSVVMFHGYNWNNVTPQHAFKYTIQGIPVLMVDVRGQDMLSPDHNHYLNGGSAGWMTKGILDPDNYYYAYVYMDCYRAVDVMLSFDGIDETKLIAEGGSQGGALTLAAASLHPKVSLALSDIPYLCHFKRSVELFNGSPYNEIYHYFKIHDQLHQTEDTVYKTLSYVDCMNLADRITCPILMSVGLEDTICPPSTGFAAYNVISAPKEMRVYPEYGHGGFTAHEEEKLKFVAKYIINKKTC
jgi:cephalosporin-C deacetylase